MKHLTKIGYATAICGLLLSSCRREQDQTAPVFTLQNISPAAVSDSICGQLADNIIPILSGQELVFEFKLSDNEALGQYKIDIHDDFDCHGHEGERSPIPTIWVLQDVVDVSGTEQVISRTLQVPSDVMAGNYHFQIKAIDAAGNENNQTPIYTLKIRNSSDTTAPAFLQLTPPPASITRGQTLTVSGTAIDDLPLENGRAELHYHSPSDEHHTAQVYTFPAGSSIE